MAANYRVEGLNDSETCGAEGTYKLLLALLLLVSIALAISATMRSRRATGIV